MKNVICLMRVLLLALLVGLFAACSSNQKQTSEETGPQAETETEAAGDGMVYVSDINLFPSWNVIGSVWDVRGSELFVLQAWTDGTSGVADYEIAVCDASGEVQQQIPLPALQSEYFLTSGGMYVDAESRIWLVATAPGAADPAVSGYRLYCFSPEGELLSEQNLNELAGIAADSINQFIRLIADADGYLYVTMYGGDGNGILIFSADGTYRGLLESELMDQGVTVRDRAGTVYLTRTQETGTELYALSGEALRVAEDYVTIPTTSVKWLGPGAETDFITATQTGISEVSIGGEQAEEIVNFEAEGVSSMVEALRTMEDGTILCVAYGFVGGGSIQLVSASQVPASTVKERQELVLATLAADSRLYQQVIAFNQESEEYRIRVKEYFDLDHMANTPASVRAAMDALNTDLIAGEAGDLLDLDSLSGMALVRDYAEKGVLEDLYGYLEQDEEFAREDFLPNLLQALETDGKLCQMVPSFYLQTVAARASMAAGDAPGQTLEEYEEFCARYPERSPFGYGTRQEALYRAFLYNQDFFVDYESAECRFDSEEFAAYLRFAAGFPDESDYEELPVDWNDFARIYSGDVLFYDASRVDLGLFDVRRMEVLMEEPVAWVGFPAEEGVGVAFDPVINLGILSASEQKDGAWEFLRFFLSDPYQESCLSAFPARQEVLEENLEWVLRENYDAGSGFSTLGLDFTFGDVSRRQVDGVLELLSQTRQTNQTDPVIVDIMQEEAAYFFAGERDAAETGAMIQSRVRLYLQERQ